MNVRFLSIRQYDLRILYERITCTTIITRDTKNFPRGNHKGENPTTSLDIESTPKVKPEKHKDNLPTVVVCLSSQQLLSHSCAPMSECVCDK